MGVIYLHARMLRCVPISFAATSLSMTACIRLVITGEGFYKGCRLPLGPNDEASTLTTLRAPRVMEAEAVEVAQGVTIAADRTARADVAVAWERLSHMGAGADESSSATGLRTGLD